MATTATLRRAGPEDAAVVGALLKASYGALYRGWYPDESLRRALPGLSRPRSELLAGGRFRLAELGGRPVACGGWTARPRPGGGGEGHLRQFATHPRHLRRGAAGAILEDCLEEARAAGIETVCVVSSLPAEPFYAAFGFETTDFALQLAPGGARFGVALMSREI